ncbi:MAG: DUF4041 domain-containing protein [Acidimicrobiales bacterium]|nr:DUF4041 domain-containing protein [Acidimicrobiales bacterium]
MSDSAPNWYPDPGGAPHLRWWDGTRWTEYTQPNPAAASPSPMVTAPPPSGLGAKRQLADENARLRAALDSMGVGEQERLRAEIDRLRAEVGALTAERDALGAEVVETRDIAMLQEVGIYEYSHPLDNAAAYKDALRRLKEQYKGLAKADRAVVGAVAWQVNGSAKEGSKMVGDFKKLMLRAYNNEVDAAVRSLRPHTLSAAVQRIDKAATSIVRLGRSMSIAIAGDYHQLRLEELRLTADYLAKREEEKERERADRERRREEEKAQRELERERARLEKEQSHYASALNRLREQGAPESEIALAEAGLADVTAAIEGVERRAANIRAGYVYVISNVGAFGEEVVKIGMTRRLEPMDRIRELGDASVPFRFDVHALVFSEDAVSLETALHQRLADRRVNLVNLRREFFYATPVEVEALLQELEGSVLEFTELAEAIEWRQSETTRRDGVHAGVEASVR